MNQNKNNDGWVKWLTLGAIVIACIVAWPAFKSCSSQVADTAQNAVGSAADLAGNAANQVKNAAGDAVNTAADMAGEATNKAVGAAGDLANGATDAAGNLVKGAAGAAGDLANTAKNAAGTAAGGLANTIKKTADFFKFEKGSTAANFANFLSSSDDTSKTFVLDKVQFATGTATLKDTSKEQLQRIAKIVKAYEGVNFELQGYTDNTGSEQTNTAVSQSRAESVKAFLISQGIPESRLTAKGLGPQNPRGDNATASGRQLNRRTEIKAYKL